MKAVGSQRSDKHLEDSCSLFEVILGDEVVRQLLEQLQHVLWWKTEVVPQPFRIRYRSALWLRSNFLNPSEFPPCILTCSKKFLPWGWAICWAISWDVRGIWSIAPTKCRSLSERPPDLSVPQCVTLSVWERRNNFLTQSAEVTNANRWPMLMHIRGSFYQCEV